MILKLSLFLFLISSLSLASAQEVKKITAVRTEKAPKIDGLIDDEVWKNVPVASGFIEFRPVPNTKEKDDRKTEVKIIYDNSAVYVSARMFDNPDSIAHELVTRDQVGNADFIGIIFDTYLDGINANGFYVTAAGSQYDAKYSQGGNEDDNWNAVWESEVKIDKLGWTAEFKIPYSALRFATKDIQNWGLNITRRRQKINYQSFWNFVDPKVSGFINQEGQLIGIEKIIAPVRLSFSPYISSYVSHYPTNQPGVKDLTSSFNGGMDVKYGINQSFTLDMTLVPDFGQVRSDNKVLNLSPFEVKFNENRPFFTEGTELFNKGNLFYSRRIGSFPTYFKSLDSQLADGDVISKYPQESKLINATKVSGRTGKGLGIGIFNAVTNRMNATVEDKFGNTRILEVQPLTNYNIFVLDQNLKNNSSVTLLNTNVLRNGSAYDANVSAFLFNLNNKGNKYNLNGAAKMSHRGIGDGNNEINNGLNYEIGGGKQSGSFNWSIKEVLSDTKFNPSDLSYFTNNNFFDHLLSASYSIYKPSKWYNQWQTYWNFNYSQRFRPRSFQYVEGFGGAYLQLKNFWSFNLNLDVRSAGNDFYESRSDGLGYDSPSEYGVSVYMNSNHSKRFNGGGYVSYRKINRANGHGYGGGFYQNFRVNDRLAFGSEVSIEPRQNLLGWFDTVDPTIVGRASGGEIYFSLYDRNTVENYFYGKYTFSNKMGITLNARHYWSDRRNKKYFILDNNGKLLSTEDLTIANRTYNSFNIDLTYFWQFAPGSEFTIVYKDLASVDERLTRRGYANNLGKTFNFPQNNSLSFKILYYLDYLQLRKKRS
ncbi:MAG: hypothetical protein JWN56_2590 [Sphingobacteriales bacterium]|nr:hypothetical protein [Sphingobacteriales bacterium]